MSFIPYSQDYCSRCDPSDSHGDDVRAYSNGGPEITKNDDDSGVAKSLKRRKRPIIDDGAIQRRKSLVAEMKIPPPVVRKLFADPTKAFSRELDAKEKYEEQLRIQYRRQIKIRENGINRGDVKAPKAQVPFECEAILIDKISIDNVAYSFLKAMDGTIYRAQGGRTQAIGLPHPITVLSISEQSARFGEINQKTSRKPPEEAEIKIRKKRK